SRGCGGRRRGRGGQATRGVFFFGNSGGASVVGHFQLRPQIGQLRFDGGIWPPFRGELLVEIGALGIHFRERLLGRGETRADVVELGRRFSQFGFALVRCGL